MGAGGIYRSPRLVPPAAAAKGVERRQAEFVTFVMHQLRDGRLPPKATAAAWRSLQQALAACPHSRLDFWYALRHNKKQGAALFLFRTHLQGLYACLPNREEKLLQ